MKTIRLIQITVTEVPVRECYCLLLLKQSLAHRIDCRARNSEYVTLFMQTRERNGSWLVYDDLTDFINYNNHGAEFTRTQGNSRPMDRGTEEQ